MDPQTIDLLDADAAWNTNAKVILDKDFTGYLFDDQMYEHRFKGLMVKFHFEDHFARMAELDGQEYVGPEDIPCVAVGGTLEVPQVNVALKEMQEYFDRLCLKMEATVPMASADLKAGQTNEPIPKAREDTSVSPDDLRLRRLLNRRNEHREKALTLDTAMRIILVDELVPDIFNDTRFRMFLNKVAHDRSEISDPAGLRTFVENAEDILKVQKDVFPEPVKTRLLTLCEIADQNKPYGRNFNESHISGRFWGQKLRSILLGANSQAEDELPIDSLVLRILGAGVQQLTDVSTQTITQ